jgi:predicted oxidoreductase
MTPEALAEFEVALNKIAAEQGWQQAFVMTPAGIKITEVFTEEELNGYREQFAQEQACKHCGGLHLRACPRIRRLVMRNREEISEVEFWRDGQWDSSMVVWPEDVFEDYQAGEADGTGTEEAASD